jgi:hypothetical protein
MIPRMRHDSGGLEILEPEECLTLLAAARRCGWSAVIIGHARMVSHGDELSELQRLSLHSWAPERRDYFIRITPELVSGRRIPESVAQ